MEPINALDSQPGETENSDASNSNDGLDIGVTSKQIDRAIKTDPKPQPQQTETKPTEKYKLKIDGADVEVDIEELKRGYNHTNAANKKFKEAAEIRDSYMRELESIKKNPKSLLDFANKLGVDFDTLAHEHILEKIKFENMSDVEKENYQYKKELAEYKAQKELELKQAEEAKLTQEQTAAQEQLDTEMLDLFPGEGRVLNEMERIHLNHALSLMLSKHQAGMKMSLKDAYALTTKHNANLIDTKNFDPSKLTDEQWALINKESIKRYGKVSPTQKTVPNAPAIEKKTDTDFFDNLNKKYGNKTISHI